MSLQDRKIQKSALSAAKALFQRETEQNTVPYAKYMYGAENRCSISNGTSETRVKIEQIGLMKCRKIRDFKREKYKGNTISLVTSKTDLYLLNPKYKNTVIHSILNGRCITVYFFVLITTHFLTAYSYASFVPLCG